MNSYPRPNQTQYDKIIQCSKQASNAGLGYVWIDTCIGKTSSAKLSEAINSMFQWFRRGWTLQELIASDLRAFFSSTWVKIELARIELTIMNKICHNRYVVKGVSVI